MDPVALQAVWKAHTDSEFITKDVEATLETMTEDAFVLNLPIGVGALGKDKVRGFYKEIFIGTLPDDWDGELKNRVVGERAWMRFARPSPIPDKWIGYFRGFGLPVVRLKLASSPSFYSGTTRFVANESIGTTPPRSSRPAFCSRHPATYERVGGRSEQGGPPSAVWWLSSGRSLLQVQQHAVVLHPGADRARTLEASTFGK